MLHLYVLLALMSVLGGTTAQLSDCTSPLTTDFDPRILTGRWYNTYEPLTTGPFSTERPDQYVTFNTLSSQQVGPYRERWSTRYPSAAWDHVKYVGDRFVMVFTDDKGTFIALGRDNSGGDYMTRGHFQKVREFVTMTMCRYYGNRVTMLMSKDRLTSPNLHRAIGFGLTWGMVPVRVV